MTTPSSLKAGGSVAIFSSVVSRRGVSSTANSTPACGFETSTGTISFSKRPSSIARTARMCDSYEYASSASRDSPHSSAITSAEIPCGTICHWSSSLSEKPDQPGLAEVGAHRHARHVLDPGRDDEVEMAGLDRGGSVHRRLHRRAALAVDRGRADRLRPARDQRGDAADVQRLLADLRHAAHLDVLDRARLEIERARRGRSAPERPARRPGRRRACRSASRSGCERRR